jgi:hypothetical protein
LSVLGETALQSETVTYPLPVEAGLTNEASSTAVGESGTTDRLPAVGDGWEAEQKGELC